MHAHGQAVSQRENRLRFHYVLFIPLTFRDPFLSVIRGIVRAAHWQIARLNISFGQCVTTLSSWPNCVNIAKSNALRLHHTLKHVLLLPRSPSPTHSLWTLTSQCRWQVLMFKCSTGECTLWTVSHGRLDLVLVGPSPVAIIHTEKK